MTASTGGTPGSAVDLTAAPEVAAAEIPAELLAQSLGQYFRASWRRIRGGDSGVLPVVLAIVVVAVSFQLANSKFLSPQNLVNLFEQSTIYMLLAMAEIFALLLGEIDLSVGLVMGLSSVVGRGTRAADRPEFAVVAGGHSWRCSRAPPSAPSRARSWPGCGCPRSSSRSAGC